MPITNATEYLNSMINANNKNINPSSELESNLKKLLSDESWITELQLFIDSNNRKFKDLDYYDTAKKFSNWFLQKDEGSLSAFLKLGNSVLTNEQMNELIKSILFRASVTNVSRWIKQNANDTAPYAEEIYSPDLLLKFLSLNNEAADALLDIFNLLYQLIGPVVFKRKYRTGITREIFSLFLYKPEEDIIYIANCLRCDKPKVNDVETLINEINKAKLINMQAQKLLNDLKNNPKFSLDQKSLDIMREYNKAQFRSLGALLSNQVLTFVVNKDSLGAFDKFAPDELNIILGSALKAKKITLADQAVNILKSIPTTKNQIYTDNLYLAYQSENIDILKKLIESGGNVDESNIIQTIFSEAAVSQQFDQRLDILMSNSEHLHYLLRGELQIHKRPIQVELLCKHGALSQWRKAKNSNDDACMQSPVEFATKNECPQEIIDILSSVDTACKNIESTTIAYQNTININNQQTSNNTQYSSNKPSSPK